MKRTNIDVDHLLIALTMAVTVPRVGWWMARWEQPDLWFVGYAAAVVFDLAILRLAYVWRRTGARRQQAVTAAGFLFFAGCSGVFQFFYLLAQNASLWQAMPLSAIWPVALSILALHKAGEDERIERTQAAAARRAISRRDVLSGTRQPRPSRTSGWTDAQRTEAVRLAASGWTVRRIADELGVPRSTVGGWVRSKQAQEAPAVRQEQGTGSDE
jgi:hypothetical protein